MKKIYALIEKQGFFILLAVCVGVIAGSGLWALSMRGSEADMREVDLQYGQRLKDAELTRMAPPVTGSVLCDYGQAEWLPTLGCWGAHEAVDFEAQKGDAVRAAKDGTVDAVYRDGRMGGVVEITHGDGLITRYCALAWPVSVTAGETVISGQTLGVVGTAALEASGGSHLHFEVWIHGTAVNPALYIVE